jgi:hypothetical protein
LQIEPFGFDELLLGEKGIGTQQPFSNRLHGICTEQKRKEQQKKSRSTGHARLTPPGKRDHDPLMIARMLAEIKP